jgi:Glycosyl hydrolase family 26
MRTIPVMLGACGQPTPELADFEATNALLAPRSLDSMLFIQNLSSEPVFYSSYKTWAADLDAMIISTMSPGSSTLNAFAGGAYDSTGLYSDGGLDGLAAECVSYGQPLIIRLAHEFNSHWSSGANPYGYMEETAAQFVAGWQHIVTLFRNQGAGNVSWMWCPNVWGLEGIPAGTVCDPTIADGSGVNWYPGDSYVDYVALDGYMSNQSPEMYTPSDLFTSNLSEIAGITSKPFGICEVGCAEDSRLSGIGGKPGWYELLFGLVPQLGCCFMNNWEQVISAPDTNQGDYTINSSGTDPAAQAAFVAGVTTYPFAAQPAAVRPALLRLGGC